MQKLHIELSNRCVLACPACPRTWFQQTLNRPIPKTDLDLGDFIAFLDCGSGKRTNHFHLESNHGDPIYSPDLLDFLRYWRPTKKFSLVTNGSRQRPAFWHQLADILDYRDSVTFSIDGLEDTNHLYRINSDWKSIIEGLDILIEKKIEVVWKTIVFRHNQHQIDAIRDFAIGRGASRFKLVNSHRFGDDKFKPHVAYVNTDRLYKNQHKFHKIIPACDQGGQIYIDASGYCWPCCWISSYQTLYKTDLWKNREKWSIRNQNLDSLLININDFAGNVQTDPKNANPVCSMMCHAD